ncbi:acyltransferase [Burkholderia vietnamiensis]|nr:acyltransferase [Burkholderia vietnamiensis]
MKENANRLQHLDSLRAVAVLFVIWAHYAEIFSRISSSWNFLNTIQVDLRFGVVGVTIFFCISGMLIPSSLKGSRRTGTISFIIKRFFRLYPAYWLSMPLGYFALWYLFDRPIDFTIWWQNLTMIPLKIGSPAIQGQYWTLQLELTFYLLCVYLFVSGMLSRKCIAAIAVWLSIWYVAGAIPILRMEFAPGDNDLYVNLLVMFWGACFRYGYDDPEYRPVVWKVGACAVAAILLMSLHKFRHGDIENARVALVQVASIGMFALGATILKIHSGVMQWIGRISYSIYLLHPVPLYIVFWAAQHYGKTGYPMPVYIAISLGATLLMSWAMFRWVEAPTNAFGHWLTHRAKKNAPIRERVEAAS